MGVSVLRHSAASHNAPAPTDTPINPNPIVSPEHVVKFFFRLQVYGQGKSTVTPKQKLDNRAAKARRAINPLARVKNSPRPGTQQAPATPRPPRREIRTPAAPAAPTEQRYNGRDANRQNNPDQAPVPQAAEVPALRRTADDSRTRNNALSHAHHARRRRTPQARRSPLPVRQNDREASPRTLPPATGRDLQRVIPPQ